jgi:hypothetical protein
MGRGGAKHPPLLELIEKIINAKRRKYCKY